MCGCQPDAGKSGMEIVSIRRIAPAQGCVSNDYVSESYIISL